MPETTLILMSTLAGPGGADDYARSAGLPTTFNGLPVKYGWVDAGRVGTFKNAAGRLVTLAIGDADTVVSNFTKATAVGVNVPIVRHGREQAGEVLGYCVQLRRHDDKLIALGAFLGDEAADEAKRCRFGAGLDRDFRDSRGNRYGLAMRHLAARPATVGQLSATASWRDGGPSPDNPLLATANRLNPPAAESVSSVVATPPATTVEQLITQLSRNAGDAVGDVFEPI